MTTEARVSPDWLATCVKHYAVKNYNHGAWHFVVECWNHEDIARLLNDQMSVIEAIQAVQEAVYGKDNIQREKLVVLKEWEQLRDRMLVSDDEPFSIRTYLVLSSGIEKMRSVLV